MALAVVLFLDLLLLLAREAGPLRRLFIAPARLLIDGARGRETRLRLVIRDAVERAVRTRLLVLPLIARFLVAGADRALRVEERRGRPRRRIGCGWATGEQHIGAGAGPA